MASTYKIKIAARVRPRLPNEIDDEGIVVSHGSDVSGSSTASSGAGVGSVISVRNPRDISQVFHFPFTSCYDQSSTQEEIFETDVRPMIDIAYRGITVTIFAYGVTSSGKTHTMQGTKSDPGVIPRVVKAMFDQKAEYKQRDVSLSVSYMEIYKDEVYDLLVPRENATKLPVRENDVGMVFVANLSAISIASIEDFDAIYSRATKQRSVGSTNLNHASSRSHAILTIEVSISDPMENKTLTGKINLVDLAGSENNKLTGNDPSRMAESAAINKSLSVLGQVVHALNSAATRIPYRNSKLTRILQDALGGTSVGLLICNLAPGTKFRQDSLNTLNFAVRTKNIENKPVINERDNRPAPKPHFAAVAMQHPVPKPAQVVLQAISTGLSGSGGVPIRSRSSLATMSRVPRVSTYGGNGSGFQPFGLPNPVMSKRSVSEKLPAPEGSSGLLGIGLTEKEIDERISKAVELEVARRLAEREKEREKEEEAQKFKQAEEPQHIQPRSKSPTMEQSLPSGVLTPLLKRHRDLDEELKARLQELERRFEHGNKEMQLADVLSPVSKKKTGRAYVALARAHSEKGDLQVALDLYRKAETYVPDNIKLKERIIEIEWAVKNNRPFVPSPKPPKKRKEKKKSKSALFKELPKSDANAMDVDKEDVSAHMDDGMPSEDETRRREPGSEFGLELTNMDNLQKSKRPLGLDGLEGEDDSITPLKKQKRTLPPSTLGGHEDECVASTPSKNVKRNAVC